MPVSAPPPSWANLRNKPTTVAGFGISDMASQTVANANNATTATKLTNDTGSAPSFSCRAWMNYNGTGQSVRASGNVSSVTWNSAGLYTVNFATALPDANYAVVLGNSAATGDANEVNVIAPSFGGAPTLMTTTQVQIGGIPDTGMAAVAVFR